MRRRRSRSFRPGPGLQLFNALDQGLGVSPFIAEDLGLIGDEVHLLLTVRHAWHEVLHFGVSEAS